MLKIPTLFARDTPDHGPRYVRDEVTPGCEWVLAGQGVATRKFDGVCVMLDDDGAWWARREVREGNPRPAGFRAVQLDPETGKTVGWEPAEQVGFYRYLQEATTPGSAFRTGEGMRGIDLLEPGTYELVGPKVNGNPELQTFHVLVHHDTAQEVPLASPLTFEVLRAHLTNDIPHYEGVVWHHPDGRMVKLKRKDFQR